MPSDASKNTSDRVHSPRPIDLWQVAAATAVTLAVVSVMGFAYLLLDILLLLFAGIVLAAALQPAHRRLCLWGVPKALAVLAIYLVLLTSLALAAIAVGPVLLEQLGALGAEVPEMYGRMRSYLQSSPNPPLRLIGQGLPPFETAVRAVTEWAPGWYEGIAGLTTAIVKIPVYIVAVLAIGYYWTMELPRFERLLLSLLAVEQRPRALNAWHEIETKLGGFIRGQGMAMLAMGTAAGVGYALIGLPNVMTLAVLAALFEVVPMIGPALAVAPAIVLALPMGVHTVLMVIGLVVFLQFLESNVLMPRIMSHAVGVSALTSLLAILAFGTLYGIAGVLLAIPAAAVVHVLVDTLIVSGEPVIEQEGAVAAPWADLRARMGALRQHARARIRARESRMGIDPAVLDHVVDALDQKIESGVARMEKVILSGEELSETWTAEEGTAILEKLRKAADEIAGTVENSDANDPEADVPLGEPPAVRVEGEEDSIIVRLDEDVRRFTAAARELEILVAAAQDGSERSSAPAIPGLPSRDSRRKS